MTVYSDGIATSFGRAGLLARVFPPQARARSFDYLTRIQLAVDPIGIAHALVRGTRPEPYQVRIAVDDATVIAACGCPMGIALVPCKHMLAVMRAMDFTNAWPPGAMPRDLDICDVRDPMLRPRGLLRPIPIAQGHVSLFRPKQTWRDRLLGADWSPPERADGKPVAVEYIVNTQPDRDDDRLAIAVAVVTRSKDGEVRRRFGLRGRTLEPEDAELVDRLFGVESVAGVVRGGRPIAVSAPGSELIGARVSPGQLDELMPRLAATGRLGWVPSGEDRLAPLAWDGRRWELVVSVAPREQPSTDALVVVHGTLVCDGECVDLDRLDAICGGGVAIAGSRLIRVATSGLAKWCRLLAGGLELPVCDVGELIERTCQGDAPRLALDAIGWTVDEPPLDARVVLETKGAGFEARAEIRYGDRTVDGGDAIVVDREARRVIRRNADAERALVKKLRGVRGALDRSWQVPGARLRGVVEALAAGGWELWLDKRRLRSAAGVKTRVESGVDWFDVSVEIADGNAVASTPELLAALRGERGFVKLSDGSVALIPPWLEAKATAMTAAKHVDGVLRFAPSEAMVLAALVEEAPELEVDAAFERLRGRLAELTGAAPRAPARGFGASLRDYQRDGLGWLHYLRELGFGGCLADDMGLGKTMQVLALVHALERKRPSLVVAPKSLVFHWLDEARRFAPKLRTLEWHGANRAAKIVDLARADLVVTTYATLRRDVARLAAHRWELVVLDEAQAIKTSTTHAARACRQLRAEQRLALTGTPVENRLDDLASIFEFLNPGLLGRPAVLRSVTDAGDPINQARALGKLLRPFLLRRTKEQVLTELPAKTELVIGCRLEGDERRRYDELRKHYRKALLPQVERDGIARSTIVVLEALLRLRQAALHPGLVDTARKGDDSAKLSALVEHLREAIDSGHRALVFSQFTTLLGIVRDRLDREGIAHQYLDGKTVDRRERVMAFQAGAAEVFLLSLKAGGTGLNLTAADHVFLLDPWWNPAVETQAIDRVHRIGQSRPVTAYRLVAEDTVEAKILALQEHKRALFAGVFEERTGIAGLTVDDLRALLD